MKLSSTFIRLILNYNDKYLNQEVIPTFDMAVNEMFFQKHPDISLEHQIQVRPFNAERTKNMRSLNPEGTVNLNRDI